MRARAKWSGNSRLRRQLRRLPKDMTSDIPTVMQWAGKELSDGIRDRAPKDQGDLASAVHFRVSNDGLGVSVGYSAKQAGFKRLWRRGGFAALFQEFGTRHHAAQPFIRPTWRAVIRRVVDRVDTVVTNTIRNLKA